MKNFLRKTGKKKKGTGITNMNMKKLFKKN